MQKFQFQIAAKTEAKHPNESENQDAISTDIFSDQPQGLSCGLFIVADGVGGHKDGSLASKTAVTIIQQQIAKTLSQTPTEPKEAVIFLKNNLQSAIVTANENIYTRAKKQNIRMASTITCALVYGSIAIIANLGDSRTYIYNGKELDQVTVDHSVVEWLVRQGHLTPEEAATHPYKNVIMHALGSHETPETEFFIRTVADNDTLVLCSDGIWDTLSDDDLLFYLDADTLESALTNITTAAQDNTDDLSLILAQITS